MVHKIKQVMRTFSYKQEGVTEDYIIANSLRAAFFYQLTPFQKELFDGIVSSIFVAKFNDLVSYRIQREDSLKEALK